MKRRVTACGMAAAFVAWIATFAISLNGQSLPSQSQTRSAEVTTVPAVGVAPVSSASSSEKQRALLDRYCVTCHNDRVKTANLSLQGLEPGES